ncbi:hypothetical protein Daus18300_002061 [Diaporthe australafricana]|uniref:Uncharacterized protein n=1 Tax=Diaporthe australafricana TaxID=127596 RepID=A0ABR3XR03_9PEZI
MAVVMLVDPSLPKHDGDPSKFTVLVGSSRTAKPQPMSVEHYQGGYLDFEDFEGLTPAQSALPTTIFLQKIVSSNYMIFVGYLESCLNELETSIRLSHVDKGTRNMTLKVSELWSILQSWSHRFPEYCGMLDDILKSHAKLRPPSPSPNQPGPQPNARNWDGCFDDFEAISVKMNALRQRTELLAESFVGLASMAGMQESLDEARNVKILTLLGVFFLPLSWIAKVSHYIPKSRFRLPGV